MGSTILNPNAENQFLKQKCNALIERVEISDRQIKDLIHTKNQMETIILNLNTKLTAQEKQLEMIPEYISSSLLQFLSAFYKIIKNVQDDNAFIPYLYKSKFAENYIKIEKNIFESYISKHTSIPLKNFKEYCRKMLFIKSNGSKCVFNDDKLQIYFINKTIVTFITADSDSSHDEK